MPNLAQRPMADSNPSLISRFLLTGCLPQQKGGLGLWLKFLLVLLPVFYLIYLNVYSIENVHHDQTRYFREFYADDVLKNRCDQDYQYGWLLWIGRPGSAWAECQVYKHVKVPAQLTLSPKSGLF